MGDGLQRQTKEAGFEVFQEREHLTWGIWREKAVVLCNNVAAAEWGLSFSNRDGQSIVTKESDHMDFGHFQVRV